MFKNFPFFPEQASQQAGQVDAVYFFLVAITAFFSLLIATLVVVFAVKYRRRHKDEIGVPMHGSLTLELLWTIIPECLVPQYSAQNRWYVPGFVAVNHSVLYRPGMTSAFTRNAGM